MGRSLVKKDLWVREGKIADPQNLFYQQGRCPDRVIDCSGHIVAPGFIDIQINGISHSSRVALAPIPCYSVWNAGGFGVDFSSLEPGDVEEGVETVARGLLAHGVTSFCPTVITSSSEYYRTVSGCSICTCTCSTTWANSSAHYQHSTRATLCACYLVHTNMVASVSFIS